MELYLDKIKNQTLGEYIVLPPNKIIKTDIDVYDKSSGELILSFKKNVIPKELYHIDKKLVKYASVLSSNRGFAAGLVNSSGLIKGKESWSAKPEFPCDKDGNILPEDHDKHTSYFKYEDGRISKRMRSNSVSSNSIGGFTRNAGLPCRLTYFTKNNLSAYETIFPLSSFISDLYFSYCPDKWLYQYDKYLSSPKEFIIPDSNFSTLTINMDFRTATHKDKGDCKTGLTCFTIKNCGSWSGGELLFPDYDIGIDVEEGDLLLFNPHESHCNNPIIGSGRMSFVLYLRDKMDRC